MKVELKDKVVWINGLKIGSIRFALGNYSGLKPDILKACKMSKATNFLLFFFFCIGVHAQSITLVNTGSGPNTGDGDANRVAWLKVNANFLSISNVLATNSATGAMQKNAGSGTNLTINGQTNIDLSASRPVFTDANKKITTPALGGGNTILGINSGGSSPEYKALSAVGPVTIQHGVGTMSLQVSNLVGSSLSAAGAPGVPAAPPAGYDHTAVFNAEGIFMKGIDLDYDLRLGLENFVTRMQNQELPSLVKPVRILSLGDSIAETNATPVEIGKIALEKWGFAGIGWESYNKQNQPTFTGTAYRTNGQTFCDIIYMSGAGATAELQRFKSTTVLNGNYCDQITIPYLTGPGLGTFKVQTNINGGGFADYVTINTSSGSRAMTYQTYTLATNVYQIKFVNVSGDSYVAGAQFLYSASGGAQINVLARGGISVEDMVTDPVKGGVNIVGPLIQAVNPDLVFVNFKEGNSASATNNMATLLDWIRTYGPNASTVVFGTWESSDGSTFTNQNFAVEKLVRDTALTNRCYYTMDNRIPKSGTLLNTLGLTDGGAHLSADAAKWTAEIFWHDAGFDSLDRRRALIEGYGSPEGQFSGQLGYTYHDNSDNAIWIKGAGASDTGWIRQLPTTALGSAAFPNGQGIQNKASVNNGQVLMNDTGIVASRAAADGNDTFTIDQTVNGATGLLINTRHFGSQKFFVNSSGGVYSPDSYNAGDAKGLRNTTSGNNAYIYVNNNGPRIERAVADANPALQVRNSDAGSTGDIVQFVGSQSGFGTKVVIDYNGKLGVGSTTVDSSAIMQVTSTTKGLLPPVMTQAQRDAISTPANGLLIYQSDGTKGLYNYISGTGWTAVTGTGGGGGGSAPVGTVVNTGASATGYVPIYTDATGTNIAPQNITGSGAIVKSKDTTQTNILAIGFTATVITNNQATATTVAIYDANKQLGSSSVTPTELGRLSGITANVQTQIDAKMTAVTGLTVSSGSTVAGQGVAYSDTTGTNLAPSLAAFHNGTNLSVIGNLTANALTSTNTISALANENITGAGAASAPALYVVGAPFSGGSASTTFPHVMIAHSTATASSTFSTSGTMFGINSSGNFSICDFMKNGVSQFKIIDTGAATFAGATTVNGKFTMGAGEVWKPATKSGNYTATASDNYLRFSATATLTLPAASAYSNGQPLKVKAMAGATITVARTGADTIDGGTSDTISATGAVMYVSDGVSNWDKF